MNEMSKAVSAKQASSIVRTDINGLRAVAVVSVLLFHFGVPPFWGGYTGVDVFFVISGYLMTSIIARQLRESRFSLWRFYSDRATRIVPALAAMLFVVLVAGWFLVDPLRYEALGLSALSSIVLLSNFLYFSTSGYFDGAAEKVWFLHTWSLSVEWQFYLIYPIILILIHKFLRRWMLPILVLATIVITIVAGVAQLNGSARVGSFVFYMTPFRASEMLLGGLVYLLGDGARRFQNVAVEIAGLIFVLLSIVVFDKNTVWPGFFWLLPGIGTALIIASDRGVASLLNREPLQRLGAWSYSIYLWHWPLVVGASYLGFHDWLTKIIGIAASILLGALSFRFVEQPTKAALRSGGSFGRFGFAASVGLVVVSAFGVWATAGVPGRLPEERRALLARNDGSRAALGMPDACAGKLCTVNPGSEAETLVLGDSHSQMFYPRIRKVAESQNRAIDMMTLAGCPPVPGVGKLSNPACGSFNLRAADLARSSRYRHIVYIAAWYADFAAYDDSRVCVDSGGSCRPLVEQQAALDAVAAFAAFVEELRGSGKTVTLVVGQPIFDINVPEQISYQSFWPNGSVALEAYPLDRALKDPAGVDSTFRRLEALGVRVVDAQARFCADSVCRLVDEQGHSIYMDGNHLWPQYIVGMSGLDAAFPPR